VTGRVTRMARYAAFIEVEDGVEGQIANRELSWSAPVRHASQVVKIGDMVEAVVLRSERLHRFLSLSLRQTLPDPWLRVRESYAIGQRIDVEVRRFLDLDVLVYVPTDIDGIIYRKDLSWSRELKRPQRMLKKRQKIETVILEFDDANRKVVLGLKQATDDPFQAAGRDFHEGDAIDAHTIELPKPGVVVVLAGGIEEFVPLARLERGGIRSDENYRIGEELRLMVVRIDYERRHILLSERDAVMIDEPGAPKRISSVAFPDTQSGGE
jgi:small subunit ribosomal protein S1